MSENLGYLFAAFAITWTGFFAYFFYVHRLLAGARQELRLLEQEQPGESVAGTRPESGR
jgi:CcmD family protein